MKDCCSEPLKTKRTSQISPAALIIGLFTLIVLIGGFILAASSNPTKLSATGAQAYTEHASFEWGKININGGKATHEFAIENRGTGELDLTNVQTSCMCTSAQFTIDGKASPYFGMGMGGVGSSWVGKIDPGKTATLTVVFDPLYHGPEAIGPIERLISVETNDPQNATMEFKVTGDVVKE